MEPEAGRTRMQTHDTRIGTSWSHIDAEQELIQMESEQERNQMEAELNLI